MKFSVKLLLWTLIVLALSLGASGFLIVNFVFETALEREIGQALDENSILGFAFETAALNIPAKYDILQDSTVEQIASNLETGGHSTGRLLRLSDEQKNTLYASEGFETDDQLLAQTDELTKAYQVIQLEEQYYVHTGITVNTLDRVLYLENMKDVSEVFQERELGFLVFRRVTVVMLLIGAVMMHLISSVLTKPIRLLTKATKRMTAGEYDYRARQVSNDELGQLTTDFNRMANALEENINHLEEELKAREDFVAAFAHELKTPLTSIIGYADLLRSRRLDEEKSFLSANYIYSEGKRLEAMSLRLLDIIVTKHSEIALQEIPCELLFDYLKDVFAGKETLIFSFRYDNGKVRAETNLMKTVLINLVDNACKASEQGGRIEITGRRLENGYCFAVRDYGIGIPKEELSNIMKAFYMVDKSRARSKNGAGLGLSLCTEILLLHGSKLQIESEPGKGTCVSFQLPLIKEEKSQAYENE